MSAAAIPFPTHAAREKTAERSAIVRANPSVKILLTLVKGETRPSDEELAGYKARGEEAPFPQWEAISICESEGAADRVIEWHKAQPDAHPRDHWQKAPFVENAILPRSRLRLEDDASSPPASAYAVVRIEQMENVRDCLEKMAGNPHVADE